MDFMTAHQKVPLELRLAVSAIMAGLWLLVRHRSNSFVKFPDHTVLWCARWGARNSVVIPEGFDGLYARDAKSGAKRQIVQFFGKMLAVSEKVSTDFC